MNDVIYICIVYRAAVTELEDAKAELSHTERDKVALTLELKGFRSENAKLAADKVALEDRLLAKAREVDQVAKFHRGHEHGRSSPRFDEDSDVDEKDTNRTLVEVLVDVS